MTDILIGTNIFTAEASLLNSFAPALESDRDETIKHVEVEIHHEPTCHVVDVPKLLKWVGDTAMSMSPAQDYRKEKLRKLLGIKKPERTKR
jgi:hypothetical protein